MTMRSELAACSLRLLSVSRYVCVCYQAKPQRAGRSLMTAMSTFEGTVSEKPELPI